MPQTAIRVREIAFMGYPVKDMARARKFYEQLLHLSPSEIGEDGAFVEYDLNGVTFSIGNYEGWNPSSTGPSIAFEMEDLDQALLVLKDAQVPVFVEPMDTPVCRMAIVGDPDGNSIILHQCK